MPNPFLNGLQAASNAIASNLSGPVDLINSGLGLLGVPVSPEPFGGSAWMKRRGLTRDVQPGVSRVIGETAGLLGPTLAAAYAPQIARGLLAVGDAMPAASAGRLAARNQKGVINFPGSPNEVYHGSATLVKEFDDAKLGRNTGSKDARIGHHFAGSKADADFYAAMAAEKSGIETTGKVGRYDLSMKNPLVIADDGNVPADMLDLFSDNKLAAYEYAVANGFDGLVYPQGSLVDSGYTAIPFSSAQIKFLGDAYP